MDGEVIDGWKVVPIDCVNCGHHFVSVCPLFARVEKLECSNCGEESGVLDDSRSEVK